MTPAAHAWERAPTVAVLMALCLGCLACGAARRPGNDSTDVLLISVDTLRADRLNCYGYDRRRTSPNIDALARDGILFQTHVAASPWTTPSHLSMLTSLPPTRHGVFASGRRIRHALRGEGSCQALPSHRVTLTEVLKDRGRATGAFTGGVSLDPVLGFGQGFDDYDVSMVKLGPRSVPALMRWMEARRGQPFFLFWHTFEVHAPYLNERFVDPHVPPRQRDRLRRRLGRLARRARQRDLYGLVSDGHRTLEELGLFTAEACDALYDGGVRAFDDHFGKLVHALKASGRYNSMLIVLTSDHGEELNDRNRGFYDLHGRGVTPELVHVPLIVKLPGQAHAGSRPLPVTSSLDLTPTILDVVGATPRRNEMEGVSLRPLWEDTRRWPSRPALSEALVAGQEQKAIRTERERLVLVVEREVVEREGRAFLPAVCPTRQLFDLVHDPRQTHNLLADPASPPWARPRADALEGELRRLLGSPGRPDTVTLGSDAVEQLRGLGYVD